MSISWFHTFFNRKYALPDVDRIKQPLRRNQPRDTDGSGVEYHRILEKQPYRGSRQRHYIVHTPRGYNPDKPWPLVMLLHGCDQTHHDIRDISDMDEVADRCGFIAVYPFVTSYQGPRAKNCWGWWKSTHISPGCGEVEDLWSIIEAVKAEFSVDDTRLHVAGLSSGACMAVAALTVHSGRIASGAALAAVPYGESVHAVNLPGFYGGVLKSVDQIVRNMQAVKPGRQNIPPLLIVHSHHDEIVRIEAAYNLRDSWLRSRLPAVSDIHKQVETTAGVAWEHSRYTHNGGESIVETFLLRGPNHGWVGGRPGRYSFSGGPHLAAKMWAFFERHPLPTETPEDEQPQPVGKWSRFIRKLKARLNAQIPARKTCDKG